MVPPGSRVATEWTAFTCSSGIALDTELYVVSVARRDGKVAIKRKLPGGDINGGHYVTIASGPRPWTLGQWWQVQVRAPTTADGVRLALVVDGEQILTGLDRATPVGPSVVAAASACEGTTPSSNSPTSRSPRARRIS